MRETLETRLIERDEYGCWTRFVECCPSGSVYALPSYLDALSAATGERFEIMGVFAGDQLVGGMPMWRTPARLGHVMGPRAFLAYLGPVLAENPTASPARQTSRQAAVLAVIERSLRHLDCRSLKMQFHPLINDIRPFVSARWSVYPNYTYIMRFGDLPAAWERLDGNVRRLVRRACEAGLTLTDDGDFESFYRLHQDVQRRKALPAYLPEAAFARFVARLKEQGLCRLYHARLPNGRAIAAQLVLTGPHPLTHTVCAGSDGENLHVGGNPFLRWRVAESLASLGYNATDLSGAPIYNPVTRFKAQFGGDLVFKWAVMRRPTLRQRILARLDRELAQARARVARGTRRRVFRARHIRVNPCVSVVQPPDS